MPKITTALRTAMPYLHDPEVKAKFDLVLQRHDEDLEEVGYEEGEAALDAVKDLQSAMDEFDERVSAKRVEMEDAIEARREFEDEDEDEQ